MFTQIERKVSYNPSLLIAAMNIFKLMLFSSLYQSVKFATGYQSLMRVRYFIFDPHMHFWSQRFRIIFFMKNIL